MSLPSEYYLVLLKSVNQTMWADRILKQKEIPHKLIPIPRHLSHDCGVCIRLEHTYYEQARNEICGAIEDVRFEPLVPS
jgi:hypothetical protein